MPSNEPSPAVLDAAALIAAARAAAFTDEHPQHAFDHFRPLAEKISPTDLPVFTGQALLMRTNIKRALDIVEPHLTTAVERLRDTPLHAIFELPALTMGLDFAAQRVPAVKLSEHEIENMLREGAPWREVMLRYLEVASHPLVGLLPAERVAAVRAGSGKLDAARDFVAIPGLFAEFAASLAGKHPFSEEKIQELGALGASLVQQMRPGRAVRVTAKRVEESVLRDRFAALVEQRYDDLQVLTSIAVGRRKADELLPALRTAIATPAADETVTKPPAPPVTTGETPK